MITTSTAKDALRGSRPALDAALKIAGFMPKGGANFRCGFHADGHASAQVYEKGGVWRVKCHGCGWCGDIFDVQAHAAGKPVGDVLKAERAKTSPLPRAAKQPRIFATVPDMVRTFSGVEATYRYVDPETKKADLVVIRMADGDGKKFIQASPTAGGYWMKAPPAPLPIYNREALRDATEVIVVEGEKCVHALRDIGIVATTSPGGAGKAKNADWSPLAGKRVYLWPDNDAPDAAKGFPEGKGIAHMRDVAAILEHLEPAPELRWINCCELGLPVKGDVADLLAQEIELSAEDQKKLIGAVMEDATPMGAAGELRFEIEETIAGRRRNIAWPWPTMTITGRALIPGNLVLICGEPGSSKSLQLIEALWFWHASGIRVAVYELEDTRANHLQRALAQMDGNANLTDSQWIEVNPEVARNAMKIHEQMLDEFGRCVWAAPDKQVELAELADWVEARAQDGCQIIAVDPVTAAKYKTERSFSEDLNFVMSVKTTARKYGARVILVTHPVKGGNKSRAGFNNLSGGAAYSRFAHAVYWLTKPEKKTLVKVYNSRGYANVRPTRIGCWIKARQGSGAGLNFAFDFDPRTLRFNDLGVIVNDDE